MLWSPPSSAPLAAHAPRTTLLLAALLYLLLPAAVVLFYFLPWPLVVAVLAGAAVWLARRTAGGRWCWPGALLAGSWPLLVLAAAIVWLSGAMPPFGENLDWHKHYAIFNALSQQAWPPRVVTADGIATLRYSLAYYVVPAAAVKLLGSAVLPSAIFAWTTLGLYLALVLAFGGTRRPVAHSFLLGGVFLLFSGADLLGGLYTGTWPGLTGHLEWWWAPFGSISSIVTNLIWTPQHALAGLLATFLVLRYPQQLLGHAGVLGAAVAVWSPFAAIGLLPVLLWAVFTSGWRRLLTVSNLLVAPGLLLMAALFLTRESAGIPAAWLANLPGYTVTGWLVFVVLEFGALAGALWLARPQQALLIGLQAGFLLALSLFHVGITNDLLMRASIPALGVLAWLAAQAVAQAPRSWRQAPLAVLLVAGLATPLGELLRAPITPRMEHRQQIEVGELLRHNPQFTAQYAAGNRPLAQMAATPVLALDQLHFTEFGAARFDHARRQVASEGYTDAALISNPIVLAPGFYRLDATFDGDVASATPARHAAHISMHARYALVRITTSSLAGRHVQAAWYSNGQPFQLSFGLGGWSQGKGAVRLTALTISAIDTGPP